MSQMDRFIHRAFEKQLSAEGYDLIDLAPVPARGDRIARARTIEEIMEEFEQSTEDAALTYIVRVRPRKIDEPAVAPTETENKEPENRLYLPDGSLNIPYLEHNAEILISCGDYALARNIYQTIHQSGQRAAQALYGIGICYENEGKIEQALAKYEEAITYQVNIDALFRIASILIRMGKDHYAAETLERALNVKDLAESTQFEMHKCAGNCWTRLDRFEQAEKHYRAALNLRPSSDEVRSNLGSLYLRQGRLEDARRSFQDAAASNPMNARAWVGLATIHEAANRKKEAHDCYARALDVDLSDAKAVYALVKLAYELRHYAVAERIVRRYCEGNPLNIHLLYSLAGLQFHLGKIPEAAANAERILALKPGFEGAKDLMRRIGQYS